jgi:cytochrome c biogenesis protein CcmG/thiol:disulfide interchange protein DsbE
MSSADMSSTESSANVSSVSVSSVSVSSVNTVTTRTPSGDDAQRNQAEQSAIKRLLWLIVLVAGLASLFAYGIMRNPNRRDNIDSVLVGGPLPEFDMPLFERYHDRFGARYQFGEEGAQLASLTGKPMIINFWASWCGPCRDEAPVLERTWRQYGDDVLVIGINTQDRSRDNARAFLSEFDLTFPNGVDENSRIGIDYGIFGLPETFFVAADGTLVYKHAGPVTQAMIDTQLESMLP